MIADDYLLYDDYWDIPEYFFDWEEEEKTHPPEHEREMNANKGNPPSDHKVASAAKRQEKRKSVDAKLKAPQIYQGKQVLKETCDSARQTHSLKNKVPPNTLSIRKKNTDHTNPTSTAPKQVRSSQRLRQKSSKDTDVAGEIAPGSQAKEVKKSYPTRQRAAVMSDTSSGTKEDENGKARCRGDKAADFSRGGREEYAVKCSHAHALNPLNFLGEIAPGSQVKGVKKSYPTRQRAAFMSNTSSGSKEDENGKASCGDDIAADCSGGGEGWICCEVPPCTYILYPLNFLGGVGPMGEGAPGG